jgi:hypothetical protein
MIRVCAWCELFLGVKPPFQKWEITHSICRPCRLFVLAEVTPHPVWGQPRALLILPRGAPPVVAHLAIPALAYVQPTTVMWDRRYRDRGRAGTAAVQRGDVRRRTPGPVLIPPSPTSSSRHRSQPRSA